MDKNTIIWLIVGAFIAAVISAIVTYEFNEVVQNKNQEIASLKKLV